MIILNNKVQCPSVRMYWHVTILVVKGKTLVTKRKALAWCLKKDLDTEEI